MMKLLAWAYIAMIIIAKATGALSWSWWIIAAPLIGYAALTFTIGFIHGFRKSFKRKTEKETHTDTQPTIRVNVQ